MTGIDAIRLNFTPESLILLDVILANCRIPEQNWGDLQALVAGSMVPPARVQAAMGVSLPQRAQLAEGGRGWWRRIRRRPLHRHRRQRQEHCRVDLREARRSGRRRGRDRPRPGRARG